MRCTTISWFVKLLVWWVAIFLFLLHTKSQIANDQFLCLLFWKSKRNSARLPPFFKLQLLKKVSKKWLFSFGFWWPKDLMKQIIDQKKTCNKWKEFIGLWIVNNGKILFSKSIFKVNYLNFSVNKRKKLERWK